jgi:hypothetical protein
VDHRVEPPAWLPQGAAPEAADPEADDSTAAEDVQQAEDSNEAPAEAAEEFANGNGNGHDSSFTYPRDDSYHYAGDDDSPFGDGTSYRSPFTPHTPAGTSYEPEEPASAENGLPGSDPDDSDDMPEPGPAGHDLPASGLSEGGLASDALPGNDLPASGLGDPAMPDTGFAAAGAGFQSSGANYTDHGSGTSYTDHGSGTSYTDHGSGTSYTDHGSGPGYADTAAASYADPAAASYTVPAAPPYPAAEPPAAAAETSTAFSGPGTAAREQRATFGTSAAAAGGIGATLRAGKQRGTARFSRGESVKSRPASSQARKANLVVSRVEPWSVMKFSFLISLVLWIVMFVAVALLYYALSSLGVFAALQRTLASVTSSQTSAGVDLTKWTSAPRILGYTMLLGAVDVVLITAIATVGAVVYNLVTHLGGGIEVTLKETD